MFAVVDELAVSEGAADLVAEEHHVDRVDTADGGVLGDTVGVETQLDFAAQGGLFFVLEQFELDDVEVGLDHVRDESDEEDAGGQFLEQDGVLDQEGHDVPEQECDHQDAGGAIDEEETGEAVEVDHGLHD